MKLKERMICGWIEKELRVQLPKEKIVQSEGDNP